MVAPARTLSLFKTQFLGRALNWYMHLSATLKWLENGNELSISVINLVLARPNTSIAAAVASFKSFGKDVVGEPQQKVCQKSFCAYLL